MTICVGSACPAHRTTGGPEPSESAGERLTALVAAHQAAVPFENLALHAGEAGVQKVDPALTMAKIVARRRGGICYEANSAVGWLLQRLGWRVAWHADPGAGSERGVRGCPSATWR